MARTFRRRRALHEYRWVLTDLVFRKGGIERIRIPQESQAGRRLRARFHSDGQTYSTQTAPHWYVNRFYERPLRQLSRQDLHRWRRDPEHPVIARMPHHHTAAWSFY